MSSNDGLRKYLEAGAALGQITRARAEELVRDLLSAGDVQRGQGQQWVDELVERSRKASEDVIALVRAEVAAQLHALGIDPEDLVRQVVDLLRRSADVGRKASGAATAAGGPEERARGQKAAAKKAPAKKKAAAKKAPAKKKAAPAKKKAAVKKAPGKKKAGAKKAPAKRTSRAAE